MTETLDKITYENSHYSLSLILNHAIENVNGQLNL